MANTEGLRAAKWDGPAHVEVPAGREFITLVGTGRWPAAVRGSLAPRSGDPAALTEALVEARSVVDEVDIGVPNDGSRRLAELESAAP